MNNIIFSEGGQPIFLDDINLLQENRISAVFSLFVGLVGNETKAFLLNPYTFDTEIIDSDNGIVKLKINANSIVVEGDIIPFPAAEFLNTEIEEKGVVCVCVKRTDAELRTFEDGQSRYCLKKTTAYLSCETAGVSEFYKIPELPSMIELLSSRLGIPTVSAWTNVPVIFYNGYSGDVRYRIDGSTIQLSINISSSQKNWETDILGRLFKIVDNSLTVLLSGITTDGLAGIPTDTSGNVMGFGSTVIVTSEGFCNIINRTSNGVLGMGYIPPCLNEDTAGTINIILKK